MDSTLFEQLLHENEGSALDFKQSQYSFVKATDEEKAELLKDILGFANGFRRTDAYVLIGVREVRGGRSEVLGITEHLDDHSLQQFVAHLTNRTIRFAYEAFEHESKMVGVIRIDLQQSKPIYLKKDFGKLRKELVYMRRGSSTDLNRPATPDEIALMGVASEGGQRAPEFSLGFAEPERDRRIGTSLQITNELWDLPPLHKLPDLQEPVTRGPLGVAMPSFAGERTNGEYYREFAWHAFVTNLYKPMRLILTNVGSVGAEHVRVILRAAVKDGVAFLDSSDVPDTPRRKSSPFDTPALRNIRPAFREQGDVEVLKDKEQSRVEIDFGTLQPGRHVWSELFFVGACGDRPIQVDAEIYAATLPRPQPTKLTIDVRTNRRKLAVRELVALAKKSESEDGE